MASSRRTASPQAFAELRSMLRGHHHFIDVVLEARYREDVVTGWFPPVYESYDAFLVIVDDLTEDLFDLIPYSWNGTDVEVILNGTRKRLM